MLLSGGGLAPIRDAAILSYGYRWYNTIHPAIDVYMHWVILRMKLEYQALGYRQQTPNRLNYMYKITHSGIYTQ